MHDIEKFVPEAWYVVFHAFLYERYAEMPEKFL
jgi:hypothetical protein